MFDPRYQPLPMKGERKRARAARPQTRLEETVEGGAGRNSGLGSFWEVEADL
jgi:hypothetical protein